LQAFGKLLMMAWPTQLLSC